MALSPRTRGCSVHAPAIHARLRVVPAHAGVLRPIRTPRCLPGSCPRARGGAPHSRRIRTIFLALSPRTRGCSFVVVSVHKVCAVVPAHAGVLRSRRPRRPRPPCCPRARGGAPAVASAVAAFATVVPAHAGVLRAAHARLASRRGCPRARGGAPGEWKPSPVPRDVVPAHAGVLRCRGRGGRRRRGLQRRPKADPLGGGKVSHGGV